MNLLGTNCTHDAFAGEDLRPITRYKTLAAARKEILSHRWPREGLAPAHNAPLQVAAGRWGVKPGWTAPT
jgi:hypothetical protein